MNLQALILQKRIVLTMGPGGVGKTTLSALWGLQAAVSGRKALVLTIDPAMRLADALGLSDLAPGEYRELTLAELARWGIAARAPLHVGMLHTGKCLTSLMEREVPAPARDKILAHPFFQRLCTDLAGSREYAAMEELHHLHLRGGFDVLVVDTPPSVQALDFLEAPDRVLDVLEVQGLGWLRGPALKLGRMGLRLIPSYGDAVLRTLKKFTGLDFLREMATFIELFADHLEGFRQRASEVRSILHSPMCAFVLVSSADEHQLDECAGLFRQVSALGISPASILVNRLVLPPKPLPSRDAAVLLTEELERCFPAQREQVHRAVRAMEQAHRALGHLAARDAERVEAFEARMGLPLPVARVGLQPQDVHDLAGLEALRRAVFDG